MPGAEVQSAVAAAALTEVEAGDTGREVQKRVALHTQAVGVPSDLHMRDY
jgi:hypothetical protein